jgi:hypothetical protein
MPLPTSGPISINMIRTELGTQRADLRFLSNLAGFSTPDSMSEFYGYSACPPSGTYSSQYCSGCNLIYVYHDGSCGFYTVDSGYSLICCGGWICDCGPGCAFYSNDCFSIGCVYC